jgi:inhibitor of KinA sporulation pathway (predicted exonuclease)
MPTYRVDFWLSIEVEANSEEEAEELANQELSEMGADVLDLISDTPLTIEEV